MEEIVKEVVKLVENKTINDVALGTVLVKIVENKTIDDVDVEMALFKRFLVDKVAPDSEYKESFEEYLDFTITKITKNLEHQDKEVTFDNAFQEYVELVEKDHNLLILQVSDLKEKFMF